jgi:hypothetical protein
MRPRIAAARCALATAALCMMFGETCRAQEWVAQNAELGVDEFHFLVAGGLNYGAAFGSELEHVDPSVGFWASGAYRFKPTLSACLSVAHNLGNVEGQLTQILDVNVRPDGRSGTVIGEVEMLRVGAGVRLDAFREQDWRYRPYVQAEVLRTFFSVTLDSVDGSPPLDEPGVARSSFDDSQWGALARVGVDARINSMLGIVFGGTFEFLEFPAGTGSFVAGEAGASFRF